ncbi:hypothetical protein LEN26_014499 [Aphanomyces euteiches]|nr:hypothetical protein LEN26_014499 [Aphanomyces euteiches]KAH9115450.1 hypothetical protein AeMF1_010503 [Aphanomyces euteiches]KAH9184469.1 hypothetical protein AeNC1_013553 [Aphanomyces euteiches]
MDQSVATLVLLYTVKIPVSASSIMALVVLLAAVLTTTQATVWQGNLLASVAQRCNQTRLCNVTVPTLSTRCKGVDFPPQDWIPPDEITCIWSPNGTVWRGMNRTRYSPILKTDSIYIKNEIRGGINITAVESWPNSAHLLILDDVGLETIPDDSSIDGHGFELLAIQFWLTNNNLTRFTSKLSSNVKQLILNGNRIRQLNLSRTHLDLLSLRRNNLTDETWLQAILPSTLTELDLARNNLTTINATWPPNLTNLNLDANAITMVSNTTQWPKTLTNLSLANNSITEVRASFPASLTHLCLSGNNITAFYANYSQFQLLSNLSNYTNATEQISNCPGDCRTFMSTRTTNVTCTGHLRIEMLFGEFPICIVADTPKPKESKSKKLVWIVVPSSLSALLAAGAIYCLCCRPRHAKWYERDVQEDNKYQPPIDITCRLHLDVRFEDQFRPYRIPPSALERHRIIARGGFGIVYEAMWKRSKSAAPISVAMKRLLPNHVDNTQLIDDFMHEIRVYATLSHPRIVQFYGITWTTINNLSIVMEFMPHGDVWSLVTSAPPTSWHAPLHPTIAVSKLSIALDVLTGLIYLHSLPVIHRDLKAKNILLGPQMEAKLSDFGTSRPWDDLTMTAEIGTAAWIAPEVLKGVRYTSQADIYSFGVFLSELDTVVMPYADIFTDPNASVTMTRTRIALLVVAGEISPRFLPESPIRSIAAQCLSHNPEARPTASQLYSILNAAAMR